MPRLTSYIQQLIDSGNYRLIVPDASGKTMTYPGEIVMNRDGIIIAYTANVIKGKTVNK